MCAKNRAATISAAEQQEVGWPLPAAVVAWIEWIRSWLAIPFKLSISISFMSGADFIEQNPKRKEKSFGQRVPGDSAGGRLPDRIERVTAAARTGRHRVGLQIRSEILR